MKKKLFNPTEAYCKAKTKAIFESYRDTHKRLVLAGFKEEEAEIIASEIVCAVVNRQLANNFYGASPMGN